MAFMSYVFPEIAPFFESEKVTEIVFTRKTCEGFTECFQEGLEKLSAVGEAVTCSTVMNHIRNDFVLSRVMFLLQITIVCLVFRRHFARFFNCSYEIGRRIWNDMARLAAAQDIKKAEEQIEDLLVLNTNVSKVAQTKLTVLEKRLESITEDKKAIEEDLASFKTTVLENQKEHLELTKRWAKHVEEIMDKHKDAETRMSLTPRKSTGIPVFLKSPRRNTPKLPRAGDR